MNNIIEIITVLAFCLMPFGMEFSQEKEETILKDFTEFAEIVRTEWKVPGMAVGVVKNNDIIFLQALGYRDVEKQLPVDSKTLFAIGSCTKSFTAMAAHMLVDDKKLDLDVPLIEYLIDFRLFDDYATLHTTTRDILCHRTGMPGYDSLWILSQGSRDEFFRRLRFLEPNSGFRDIFQYNNLMYMVAGILVGRLSNSSWEEFIADRIFKPLNMEHSNFSVTDTQVDKNFAKPYITFNEKIQEVSFRNLDTIGPAGSINSCIEDLVKWIMLLVNNGRIGDSQLISEKSVAEMFLPHVTIRNPVYAKMSQSAIYGQGWYISDYRRYRLVEHGGNIDGFSALLSILPDEKIGVVVISNSFNFATHVLAREVFDRLLGLENKDWNSYFQDVYADIIKMYASSAAANQEAKPNTNPSLTLKDYTGVYIHPAFGRVEVKIVKEKLRIIFQSGLSSELEHFHFDLFKGRTSDFYLPLINIHFHLNSKGLVDNFTIPLQEGVSDIVFKRIKEN